MAQNQPNQNRNTNNNRGIPELSADEKEKIRQIITADADGKILVEFADSVGKQLVEDKMSRSQIRNIFSEARLIDMEWKKNEIDAARRRLNLLKPKMEYQKAREDNVSYLVQVLNEAVDQTQKASGDTFNQAFKRFMEFFEAILAYQRKYGGK